MCDRLYVPGCILPLRRPSPAGIVSMLVVNLAEGAFTQEELLPTADKFAVGPA
jgi:hypothetical protein